MTTADTPAVVIPRQAWQTLAITSIVGFMVSLEITIISLALPEIAEAFPSASGSTLSWIIAAYNIGVAALLLVAGWLADRYGRKRVFLTGLGLFAVMSLLTGVAWNIESLLLFRALQSVGGAMQYPAGLALLLTAFPIQRRQMAIGIWGAMGALAAALGPSLGALLIDAFNWRAVFLINVPVAIVALFVGARVLTESVSDQVSDTVDLISVPLASIGVGAIVLGISQGEDWGWASPGTVVSFVLGAALLVVFVVRSMRQDEPLFDLGLFRFPSYSIGNIGAVFFTAAFFGWLVLLPTFIQSQWGWSVLKTGFAIAPGPLIAMFISPPAGRLADRIGNAPILAVGGVAGAIGMLLHLLLTDLEPDYLVGLFLPGVFIGIAAGCSFAMLVGATMRDVPPAQFGMGGAGRTTVFQLAIATGVAVAFAVLATPDSPDAFLDAIQRTWVVSLILYLGQAVTFGAVFPRLAGSAPAR